MAMSRRDDPAAALPVVAVRDALCLDYANTRFWRGSDAPSESLNGIGDLLDWLAGVAALPAEIIAGARECIRGDSKRAQALLGDAIALREAIYGIFSAVAAGEGPLDRELASLNDALAAAPRRRRLAWRDGGYGWQIETVDVTAANLLAPVLWSASELLLNAAHRRIRRCANDRCLWLFVDTSKSGTRRWCDMGACGNRAKAARHYAKVRRANSG